MPEITTNSNAPAGFAASFLTGTGAGNALRSTLLFGVIGSASRIAYAEGVMYAGN